jgi:hypothetical protein
MRELGYRMRKIETIFSGKFSFAKNQPLGTALREVSSSPTLFTAWKVICLLQAVPVIFQGVPQT